MWDYRGRTTTRDALWWTGWAGLVVTNAEYYYDGVGAVHYSLACLLGGCGAISVGVYLEILHEIGQMRFRL